MEKLLYTCHILLISKYRLFINLSILLIIYLSFYGGKIAYCMNENTNIIAAPAIAESKSLASNSTLAKDILITEQQKQIDALKAEAVSDKKEIQKLLMQVKQQRQQNGLLGRRIGELKQIIAELKPVAEEAEHYKNAYTEQCKLNGRLGARIHELKQEVSSPIEPVVRHTTKPRLTQGSDTDSDSWRVYGDTREPYYTNYGSDSDNDLGETW